MSTYYRWGLILLKIAALLVIAVGSAFGISLVARALGASIVTGFVVLAIGVATAMFTGLRQGEEYQVISPIFRWLSLIWPSIVFGLIIKPSGEMGVLLKQLSGDLDHSAILVIFVVWIGLCLSPLGRFSAKE